MCWLTVYFVQAVESDGDEVLPLDENFQQEINRIFDEDLQKDDINEEIGAIETPPEQVPLNSLYFP